MYGVQINTAISKSGRQSERGYAGLFTERSLLKHKPQVGSGENSSFIVNTGQHWILLYFNCFYNKAILMDSYGESYPALKQWLIQYMPRNYTFVQNHQRIQSFNSDVCGWYCIYFIYYLGRGVSFAQLLGGFGSSGRVNDKRVLEFSKCLKV